MEAWFPDSLIGQRLEHYDIERLLGVGGMAHVYLARDTLLGREVRSKHSLQNFSRTTPRLSASAVRRSVWQRWNIPTSRRYST